MKVAIRLGAVALALATMLLAGCLSQVFRSTVNPDGTGTNVFEIGISKRALSMFEGMVPDEGGEALDPFSDLTSTVSQLPDEWKARAESWEDDSYKGVRIITQFASLAMMREQLATIMDRMRPATGEEGDGPGAFGGPNIQMGDNTPMLRDITVEEEDGNITIQATAGLSTQQEADGEAGPGQEMAERMLQLFGPFRLRWTVELPTLTSYSPEEIATRRGNAVTFNFELNKEYKLVVTGSLTPSEPADDGEGEGEGEGEDNNNAQDNNNDAEDDGEFDASRMEEYLNGTWRFDLDSVRAAFRAEEEVPEAMIEMMAEMFRNMRVVFDNGTMRMTGGPEDNVNRFKIKNRAERSLTLQNEDEEDMVVTFVSRTRITIKTDDMPAALLLIRQRG